MNKLLFSFLMIFTLLNNINSQIIDRTNSCITFTVGQGTGCNWMCNYCSSQLGTNNYYFIDDVCSYQTGGCVGEPISGKEYTCCSVNGEL
jgi:hypothetical protein